MVRHSLGFSDQCAVGLVSSFVRIFSRLTITGLAHIPATGGVIIVPNHISHADPLISAYAVHEGGRWPQFLGKASVFRVPLLGAWLRALRQIPVERGTVEAARAVEALVDAVRAGGAVVIYPEGTTTRHPQLWPMRGKTGAARVALTTGAPVIPLAMWGAEQIFDPRTARLRLRPFTPIRVAVGPPVDLSRWADASPTKETLTEMTDEIMLRIRDLLAGIRDGTPPPLWARDAPPIRPNPDLRPGAPA